MFAILKYGFHISNTKKRAFRRCSFSYFPKYEFISFSNLVGKMSSTILFLESVSIQRYSSPVALSLNSSIANVDFKILQIQQNCYIIIIEHIISPLIWSCNFYFNGFFTNMLYLFQFFIFLFGSWFPQL